MKKLPFAFKLKKLKKVLYISYDGLTDPLGQSQVLPYLLELGKRGYCFTILSFEKSARMEKEGPLIRRLVDEGNIKWVPLTFASRPPVLAKIYDRQRMWRTAAALQRKEKFDLVHCRSYVAAEIGLKLKRRFGTKMLFDMRGFWADEKIDNGQWNTSLPLYRAIYRFYKGREREFLLAADGVVSLTQAAKQYLLQQPAYRHISVDVIPCCADLAHFDHNVIQREQIEAMKRELNIPNNARVLSYLGSVGGWYMTREMFAFFKVLLQHCPEYIMLLLTKDDPEKVVQEAASLGISPETLIVTYAARKKLPVYLSLCDYSVFFIRKTFSKMASSPTKHAELMGMGIPVICNDIGDTGEIIRATKTGILVDAFNNDNLELAVQQVLQHAPFRKEDIRTCALEYFDLHEGVRRYAALYQRILAGDHEMEAPAGTLMPR